MGVINLFEEAVNLIAGGINLNVGAIILFAVIRFYIRFGITSETLARAGA